MGEWVAGIGSVTRRALFLFQVPLGSLCFLAGEQISSTTLHCRAISVLELADHEVKPLKLSPKQTSPSLFCKCWDFFVPEKGKSLIKSNKVSFFINSS